jgi:hypothetical protein
MQRLLAALALALAVYAATEDSGVVITLTHPHDGAEVTCPLSPQLELAVGGSGPLVDRIKYAPNEVSLFGGFLTFDKAYVDIESCMCG